MKYSIILPTYNEALNVSAMVRSIRKLYGNEPEILIVDDRSPDGTFEQASALFARALSEPEPHLILATELFGGDVSMDDPAYELRCLPLPRASRRSACL